MSHTQAPWIVEADEDDGIHVIRMGPAAEIRSGYECHQVVEYAHGLYPEDGVQYDEADANARLIAAAPELLAAARLTVLHFQRNQVSGNFQGDDEHEAWTALDVAILKAEGVQA